MKKLIVWCLLLLFSITRALSQHVFVPPVEVNKIKTVVNNHNFIPIGTWDFSGATVIGISSGSNYWTKTEDDLSYNTGDVSVGMNFSAATYGNDGSVTNAELLWINTVTSNVQDQLNLKAVDSDVLKKDGSVGLTSNWDVGAHTVTMDGLNLDPSSIGSDNIINITPSAALSTESAHWDGIGMNLDALDPTKSGVEIHGIHIDLSGVDQTNNPEIRGLYIEGVSVYTGDAGRALVRVEGNGQYVSLIGREGYTIRTDGVIQQYFTAGADAITLYSAHHISIDPSLLDATSGMHVIDISTADGVDKKIAAIGTHPNVDVIHQHIGIFTTPSQTEYAARVPDGGSWTDGIDGHEIFVADDDEIYIGSTTKFSELEVIMTSAATKDIKSEFYYYNVAGAWIQFIPLDGTSGFQTNGEIIWDSDNFTNWKSDYDPGGVDGGSGYYIKIKRTKVADPGTPTPTTIKILIPEVYKWDENGDLNINGLEANSFPGDTVCVILEAIAWDSLTTGPTLNNLSAFTSSQYWSFDDTAPETLMTTFEMPEYCTSIAFWEVSAIAKTNTGDYDIEFYWEGYAHDEAVANDLTLANTDQMDVGTPSASGDRLLQRQNLTDGDLTSLSAGDYVQCLFIRDADDGTDDDASGYFDFLALKIYFIREK